MPKLVQYEPPDLQAMTRLRSGEQKLGEKIKTADQFSPATRCVLFGIPEDIGVRANFGTGGTHSAWAAFLEAFLNIQSTAGLTGENIGLLGYLDCTDLMEDANSQTPLEMRTAVEILDREVEAIVYEITASGRLPIVIGGGHNNAYPIIRGAAKGYRANGRITEASLNAINLDAHADFRPPEGRHSGNGFRYAFQEDLLDRYAVIGLHKNYNAQSVIDTLAKEERIFYTFWEDMFLEEEISYLDAIKRSIYFTRNRITGIELDLDCLENILSSAMTPSGIPVHFARRFLHICAAKCDLAYLHLCEGAVQLENGKVNPNTGKLLTYLISDFLRKLASST